jgi:outer membrane protein assembly factor BamB
MSEGGIDPQATATAAGPVVAAWWSNAGGSTFINTHRLTEVKVARIDVDGKYFPGAPGIYFVVPPLSGNVLWANSIQAVPQLTAVVTLKTAVPRGYGARGRIFPPPQALQITSNGMMTPAVALQSAQYFKLLIDNLNAVPVVGNVIVASRGKGHFTLDAKGKKTWTFPDPGAQNNVTEVSVGTVMDTQRRRRRQLVEQRQAVVIA